jgi:hypothetical protein
MAEPLTVQLVLEELKRLHVAFPQNVGMRTNPTGTADVYRNGLRGLSGDAVRAAASVIIQNDQYFPKVARLRELATEWTKRNARALAPTHPVAWNVCPICFATAEPIEIERYVVDARGRRTGAIEKVISLCSYMQHDPARHHVQRDAVATE